MVHECAAPLWQENFLRQKINNARRAASTKRVHVEDAFVCVCACVCVCRMSAKEMDSGSWCVFSGGVCLAMW